MQFFQPIDEQSDILKTAILIRKCIVKLHLHYKHLTLSHTLMFKSRINLHFKVTNGVCNEQMFILKPQCPDS